MIKIKNFVDQYISNITKCIKDIDLNKLQQSVDEIYKTIQRNGSIYVCGNGGSAAIANHYVVDFLKFFREKTKLKPKIFSLSNNIETVTAISNDINYNKTFSFQAESYCEQKDLLIIVSSSGNSENIINLLKFAKQKKIKTVGFSGFDGGHLKKKSDISIHIDANNYGISEDAHHILMHIQLQYLIDSLKSKK